jgi:N6-L-threonylcarbamoyladenine synthase
LKTAVLREVQKYEVEGRALPVADMAASFQAAVIETLFEKSMRAAEAHHVKEILLAGGVSANQALRQTFLAQDRFTVHIPALSLCTDNAAMVASAGYFRFALGHRDGLGFDAMPNWPLSSLGS